MKKEQTKKLVNYFKTIPSLKLVYFFGSRARKDAGPMSDHDFAVYFDGIGKSKMFDLRIKILLEITGILGTDQVDVAQLNFMDQPELEYAIITEGELIYEIEPSKISLEPYIMNRFFDFREHLRKHKLTKA